MMESELPPRIGDYEILRILGKGGMGQVLLARQADGTLSALKLMHPHLADDVEFSKRFRREARIASDLDHPNVVKTLDAGSLEGSLFIATEFMPNGDLHHRLEAVGPLEPSTAMRIVRDLLRGLSAIERSGLVHRDVKPGNLLIGGDGRILLADLGLARSTSAARSIYTQLGVFFGTPHFAAPEHLEGRQDLDIRSDLYAAGAVLYFALTKRYPAEGRSAVEIMRYLAFVGRPLKIDRVLPEAVDAFLHWLLQKDRELRPATAAAAADRADEILSALAVSGTDDRLPEPPLRSDESGRRADLPTIDIRARHSARIVPPTVTWRDAPIADQGRSVLLKVRGDSMSRRLDWKINDERGSRTMSVFAGTRLTFGRSHGHRESNHVALRLMPEAENVQASGRISGKQFQCYVRNGEILIADLRSTGGTTLNGRRLDPLEAEEISMRNEVVVAGVLRLVLRVFPAPSPVNYVVVDRGETASLPFLVVERPDNGRELVSALCAGRMPMAPGLEVFAVGESLFVRSSTIPPDTCLSPDVGFRHVVDGCELELVGRENR